DDRRREDDVAQGGQQADAVEAAHRGAPIAPRGGTDDGGDRDGGDEAEGESGNDEERQVPRHRELAQVSRPGNEKRDDAGGSGEVGNVERRLDQRLAHDGLRDDL